MLSQYKEAVAVEVICRSLSNEEIQTNSETMVAMARYTMAIDDLEIMTCFLDFHDTRESLRNIQKSMIEHLVSLHPTQLESGKA